MGGLLSLASRFRRNVSSKPYPLGMLVTVERLGEGVMIERDGSGANVHIMAYLCTYLSHAWIRGGGGEEEEGTHS